MANVAMEPHFTLKMIAARFFETLVSYHITIRCHNPGDGEMHEFESPAQNALRCYYRVFRLLQPEVGGSIRTLKKTAK
jgi:hypothetical protein